MLPGSDISSRAVPTFVQTVFVPLLTRPVVDRSQTQSLATIAKIEFYLTYSTLDKRTFKTRCHLTFDPFEETLSRLQ